MKDAQSRRMIDSVSTGSTPNSPNKEWRSIKQEKIKVHPPKEDIRYFLDYSTPSIIVVNKSYDAILHGEDSLISFFPPINKGESYYDYIKRQDDCQELSKTEALDYLTNCLFQAEKLTTKVREVLQIMNKL